VGASAGTCVLVGVTTDQPAAVVTQAVTFARHFGATLVCAHVAAQHHVIEEHPDGSVESRPLDPDAPEWTSATFDPDLARRIVELTAEAGVTVEFRELAGDVGHALGRLAEVLGAAMIVVGSRRGRFRTSMHDFLSGSVAVHLAHRQPRPVVVVPLDPQPQGRLPWEHDAA
jgi:nucleotide-binding universal stress UspA family protein